MLIPTKPRRLLGAGRPIHQLFVTHCLYGEGVVPQAGFGVRASSTLDPLLLRFVLEYPSYEVPAGMAPGSLTPASAPRRLALVRIPGGRSALIHSAYLPDEARGRANNFFTHALILPSANAAEALSTWASPDWRTGLPEDTATALSPRTGLPRPGPVNDGAVTRFLASSAPAEDENLATLVCPQRLADEAGRRRELLEQTLRGCLLALQAGPVAPRNRFYLLAEPGLTALLFYAAACLLPQALSADLTFSTYENAHRDLRAYPHARAVGTWLASPDKGLEEEFFTTRGYALDTFSHRCSPELEEKETLPVGEWVDLAAQGEWSAVDRIHRLLGKKTTTMVSFQEAARAARLSRRLAAGQARPRDLLTLRSVSWGQPVLERHRDQVWPLVRDQSPTDARLAAAFADLLRAKLPELEQRLLQALKAGPDGWQPHGRLIWSLLEHDPARRRDSFQRIFAALPDSPDIRAAVVRELHHLGLTPVDGRLPLQRLLHQCRAEDFDRLGADDLPRKWLVWALIPALLRPDVRAEAVHRLTRGDPALVGAFWGQVWRIKDEAQQQAILSPLIVADGSALLSGLLQARPRLSSCQLGWLLEALAAFDAPWQEFWCRDGHLAQLLEVLRAIGSDAGAIWERLCGLITENVLLPGAQPQRALLTELSAVQSLSGSTLPLAASQAVADWVLLREHFEKASPVLAVPRTELHAACSRRGLDLSRVLARYFARFVLPFGTRKEVLDDFAGFFHTFYPEGNEYPVCAARLLGWLRLVAACPDEGRADYQRYYLEHFVPTEHRPRLADEMRQAGLLPAGAAASPTPPVPTADTSTTQAPLRPGENDALFPLVGVRPNGQLVASLGGRLLWLSWALGGGLLVALLSGLHAAQLKRMPALALFVPLVVALAESMALQSAGLAARRTDRARRAIGKEVLVGAVLGLLCGVVAAGVALAAWAVPTALALVLGGAVGGGMVGAALLGAGLPVLLARLRWGARVAAGPVARALADTAAVLLYFRLARWLLG